MAGSGRGFTIVELMVVLAIVATVSMLAAPSFVDMLHRRRLEGAANELSADLQYTRTEAVSRRQNVTLAASNDGLSYAVTAATASADVVLKTVSLPGGISVDAGKTVTYTPLRGSPSSADDVSITVQSSKTQAQLTLTVNAVGQLRMCSPSSAVSGYAAC